MNGLSVRQKGERLYTIGGAGRQNFKMDQDLFKIKWNSEEKAVIGNKIPRTYR